MQNFEAAITHTNTRGFPGEPPGLKATLFGFPLILHGGERQSARYACVSCGGGSVRRCGFGQRSGF